MKRVFFDTEDGLELSGLLQEEKSNKVVIAVHGIGSSCMKKRDEMIGEKVNKMGISYFSFNNRGHDAVTIINKETVNGNIPTMQGSSFEDVEESYYDIKAAIVEMLDRGYTEIYLQGHSLGCTKILYTYHKLIEKQENDILEKIKGVLLLSLVDIVGLVEQLSMKYEKEILISKLQREIQNPMSCQLFRFTESFPPMSAKTLLRYIKNNQNIDVANYRKEKENYLFLQEIQVPLFMRWGTEKELVFQPIKQIIQRIEKNVKNKRVDINVIEGATHNYTGKEEELANQIILFLEQCCIE